MDCIKLKSITGEVRLVEAGKPYRKLPDEEMEPGVFNCDGSDKRPPKQPSLAHELNTEIGAGAGDWIKVLAGPVAKMIGKENCSPCEAKRIVTNAYGKLRKKHGMKVALGIINELWKLAPNDPEAALVKLQGYIHD